MLTSRIPPGGLLMRMLSCSALLGVCSELLWAQSIATCTRCHSEQANDQGLPPSEIDNGTLNGSIHDGFECIACHENIASDGDSPGSAPVGSVDCTICHEEEGEVYKKHGRLVVGSDADIPRCQDCHGSHDIFPSSDKRSRTNPTTVPDTCRSCHTDVDLVRRHQPINGKAVELYEKSVHGDGNRRGVPGVARCNDCHSAKGPDGTQTAHRTLSPYDPESPTYHFNISDTCGRCHEDVASRYWEGVHGELVKQGSLDSPVCTDCHGEHGIVSPNDPRSPVSAARLAEQTCGRCHASTALNERMGVPPGTLRSYIDTYHGLKRKAGDVHIANCASCHGNHRILRHTDPRSRVNTANLQQTCGECHPGISQVVATSSIHAPGEGVVEWWPNFFRILYLWIIAITIGAMLVHNLLHWFRHVRNAYRAPSVVRLSPGETAQHWLLMVSFIVLVVSGFSLRHSEAWWVRTLFGWGGGEGFVIRGVIHRIAAVAHGMDGLALDLPCYAKGSPLATRYVASLE